MWWCEKRIDSPDKDYALEHLAHPKYDRIKENNTSCLRYFRNSDTFHLRSEFVRPRLLLRLRLVRTVSVIGLSLQAHVPMPWRGRHHMARKHEIEGLLSGR